MYIARLFAHYTQLEYSHSICTVRYLHNVHIYTQLGYLQAAIVLLRTLEDLLGHHSCNIIVGPPSCGKTALWKLLMKTLQKAYIEANTDINLVPDDVLKALHVRFSFNIQFQVPLGPEKEQYEASTHDFNVIIIIVVQCRYM